MPYRTLADFLEDLAHSGDLHRVPATVTAELEVAEITARVAQAGGPALLFDRVDGHPMAVVTNLLGTTRRVCQACGVDSLDDLAERIAQLVAPAPPSWLDRLRATGDGNAVDRFQPKTIKSGPCQQVVRLGRDVDLADLPALQCWPSEAQRMLTAGQMIARDRAGEQRTWELRRCAVLDKNRLAIINDGHGHLERLWASYVEEWMPVALVLGGHPAGLVAASIWLPPGVDGCLVASVLQEKPLELVKCRSHGLEVPAQADIVVEGYIDPLDAEVTLEASGVGTGHMRAPSRALVMQVAAVTHRTNPVFPAIVPGVPGELSVLEKTQERLLLPVIRSVAPEVVDVSLPLWSAPRRFAVVSIRKSYPFQARKVASALWGLPQLACTKLLVLVDAEVDVQNHEDVFRQIGASVHPGRDAIFYQGPADVADHATPTAGLGHHLGLDATAKLPGEHPQPWPDRLQMSDAVRSLVEERWAEYGFSTAAAERKVRVKVGK